MADPTSAGTAGNQETNPTNQQGNGADEPKKPADKPIAPNEDVEGGNGPVST